ncbi:hypothetical protein AT51_01070 [Streptococcus equi subsp. zooepidemicus Sz57]|nr:hypothetical protein AT51_01070 [Streptococcus equi subsp. zooepidemicus Sz57]
MLSIVAATNYIMISETPLGEKREPSNLTVLY